MSVACPGKPAIVNSMARTDHSKFLMTRAATGLILRRRPGATSTTGTQSLAVASVRRAVVADTSGDVAVALSSAVQSAVIQETPSVSGSELVMPSSTCATSSPDSDTILHYLQPSVKPPF